MKASPIEFFETVRPVLADGRTVSFNVSGNSMLPFLKHGAAVTLKSRPCYRRWDIVFAKVDSEAKAVLHYIAGEEGEYYRLMGAANLCQTELCRKTDVAGGLEHPHVSPWKVRLWHALLPLRRYLLWLCKL